MTSEIVQKYLISRLIWRFVAQKVHAEVNPQFVKLFKKSFHRFEFSDSTFQVKIQTNNKNWKSIQMITTVT